MCSLGKSCKNQIESYCLNCPRLNLCNYHYQEHVTTTKHYAIKYNPETLENLKIQSINEIINKFIFKITSEASRILQSIKTATSRSIRSLKNLRNDTLHLSQLLESFPDKFILDELNLKILQFFPNEGKELELRSPNLYVFEGGSKELISFDTRSGVYSFRNIENIEEKGHMVSICKVPTGLFVYGGGKAWHLDLYTLNVQSLPNGLKRYAQCCQFYENKVYVFGDHGNSSMSECHYFDMRDLTWNSLQSLPGSFICPSSLVINESILLSTNVGLLYQFDIKNNVFKKLKLNIAKSIANVLIMFGYSVFLVDPCCVYKGIIEKKGVSSKWLQVQSQKNECFKFMTASSPVMKGEKAYFTTMNKEVLRFNCRKCTLKLISSFNNK